MPFATNLSESSPSLKSHAPRVSAADVMAATARCPELSRIKVCQALGDLPRSVQARILQQGLDVSNVKGVFSNGIPYVVAANLESVEEGIKTALHEAIGHEGIRIALGERFKPVMRTLYESFPREHEVWRTVSSRYGYLDTGTDDGRIAFAEELTAHMAETAPEMGELDMIKAEIRANLREQFPELPMEEWEVHALIQRSRESLTLRHGQPADVEALQAKLARRSEVAQKLQVYAQEQGKGGPDPLSLALYQQGSRVLDPDGLPTRLYHGAGGDVGAIKGTFWGSTDPALANDYAELRASMNQPASVVPYYADIRRPFDGDPLAEVKATFETPDGLSVPVFIEEVIRQSKVDDLTAEGLRELGRTLRQYGRREESGPSYSPQDFWYATHMMFGLDGREVLSAIFSTAGFDGVRYTEQGSLTYGAFDVSQLHFIDQGATLRGWQPDRGHGVGPESQAAFAKWFGESKAVDAEGKPLRLYHGTASDFSVFGTGRGAIYTTPEADIAAAFARATETEEWETTGPVVMPIYLSLQNPLVLDHVWAEDYLDETGELDWIAVDNVLEDAPDEGYDGAILKGIVDFAGITKNSRGELERQTRAYDQYIAFRPEQIKSALANVGTYDPNNPDIRFSVSASASDFRGYDPRKIPSALLHGTEDHDFQQFKRTSINDGFFFTDATPLAEGFAGVSGRIVEAKLSLKNPADLRGMPDAWEGFHGAGLMAQLQAAGFDGAVYYEPPGDYASGDELVYVAFNARDIRITGSTPVGSLPTPEKRSGFDRWFADSVVVDAKGQPLTVYSGTPDARGIIAEGFKPSPTRGAVYFATDNYGVADTYADDSRALDYQNAEPQTLALHLSIQNPYVVDGKGQRWRETERHIQEAKALGHDGIIIKNSRDEYNHTGNGGRLSTVYAVFDPAQIAAADPDAPLSSRIDGIPLGNLSVLDRRQWDGPAPTQPPQPPAPGSQRLEPSQEALLDWFGDSKITDEQGKPLKVYHGTLSDHADFDLEFAGSGNGLADWGEGIYCSGPPAAASEYAEGEGGNVRAVYLRMRNPATLEVMLSPEVQDALDDDMGFTTPEEVLKGMGFDGVAIQHPEGVEYVVFDPEQIRSVFDPAFYAPAPTLERDDIQLSFAGESAQPARRPISDVSRHQKTRAFAKWFGESRVVDEKGHPKVVYKGMYPYDWESETVDNPRGNEIIGIKRSAPLPAFSGDEPGVEVAGFFGDADTANHFASLGLGGAVYPVYLSLETPYEVDATGQLAGNIQFGSSGKAFREAMRSGRYDGAILHNTSDEGTVYITTRADQAKSIYNSGAFNPLEPDMLLSFVGESARSMPRHQLRYAEQALTAGIDPEVVRQETGWFQGAEGRWRFEISDHEAKVRYGESTSSNPDAYIDWSDEAEHRERGVPLGNVLDHPALFDAYPVLKSYRVKVLPPQAMGDALAGFDEDDLSIKMVDPYSLPLQTTGKDPVLSVILHELQHAIQSIEGFARGGNVEQIRREAGATAISLPNRKVIEDAETIVAEWGRAGFDSIDDFVRYVPCANFDEWQDATIHLAKHPDRLAECRQQLDAHYNAPTAYRQLAGEVEARNVEARLSMTSEQRQQVSPLTTEDTPRGDQGVTIQPRQGIAATSVPAQPTGISLQALDAESGVIEQNLPAAGDFVDAMGDIQNALRLDHGWLDGGCVMLAEALHQWSGGEIDIALWGPNPTSGSHAVGVLTLKELEGCPLLIDGDGVASYEDMARKLALLEQAPGQGEIATGDKARQLADAASLPSSPALSKRIVSLLNVQLGSFEQWSSSVSHEMRDLALAPAPMSPPVREGKPLKMPRPMVGPTL